MVERAGRGLGRRELLRLVACGAGFVPVLGDRRGAAARREWLAKAQASPPVRDDELENGLRPSYVFDTDNLVPGGNLVAGKAFGRDNLDPLFGNDSVIFEPLIYVDPVTLLPAPRLATSIDVSPDGRVYTVTLKEGVRWHDTRPFTADDVKFTFDLIRNPASGFYAAPTLSEQITAVETPTSHTVVITTADPYAPFLAELEFYFIVPKHLLGHLPPEEVATSGFSLQPVGTGPFTLGEFQPGEYTTFVANPAYHEGVPALASYTEKVVGDQLILLQQLTTGEIDVGAVSSTLFEEVRNSSNIEAVVVDSFSCLLFAYNLDETRAPVFTDQAVRRALFHAIDRQTIVDRLLNGLGTVAIGTQPPISWAYQPEKLTTTYEHDPAKAEAMLDAAGWAKGSDGIRTKDGRRFGFTLHTYAGDRATEGYVLVLQEQFLTIGVEVTPVAEDPGIFFDRLYGTRDFEAALTSFGFTADPDPSRLWGSQGLDNASGYRNPRVDALLAEALTTFDRERRKALYLEVENQVLADAPALPLHFPQTVHGISRRVRNYFPSASGTADLNNPHLWYVTDGR